MIRAVAGDRKAGPPAHLGSLHDSRSGTRQPFRITPRRRLSEQGLLLRRMWRRLVPLVGAGGHRRGALDQRRIVVAHIVDARRDRVVRHRRGRIGRDEVGDLGARRDRANAHSLAAPRSSASGREPGAAARSPRVVTIVQLSISSPSSLRQRSYKPAIAKSDPSFMPMCSGCLRACSPPAADCHS